MGSGGKEEQPGSRVAVHGPGGRVEVQRGPRKESGVCMFNFFLSGEHSYMIKSQKV